MRGRLRRLFDKANNATALLLTCSNGDGNETQPHASLHWHSVRVLHADWHREDASRREERHRCNIASPTGSGHWLQMRLTRSLRLLHCVRFFRI